MRTITARFDSMGTCGHPIKRGDTIGYSKGAARWDKATTQCAACHKATAEARTPDGKCWKCEDPNGFFRNLGAGSPVWCDKCAAEHRAQDRNNYGSRYTRFSSGAEVYTNRRGRCEDAPCCGCCS